MGAVCWLVLIGLFLVHNAGLVVLILVTLGLLWGAIHFIAKRKQDPIEQIHQIKVGTIEVLNRISRDAKRRAYYRSRR